jgi:hypothetical protein
MHGGPSPGAPKGNQNAFKHGRYTAEAIARRRQLAFVLMMTAILGMFALGAATLVLASKQAAHLIG